MLIGVAKLLPTLNLMASLRLSVKICFDPITIKHLAASATRKEENNAERRLFRSYLKCVWVTHSSIHLAA